MMSSGLSQSVLTLGPVALNCAQAQLSPTPPLAYTAIKHSEQCTLALGSNTFDFGVKHAQARFNWAKFDYALSVGLETSNVLQKVCITNLRCGDLAFIRQGGSNKESY